MFSGGCIGTRIGACGSIETGLANASCTCPLVNTWDPAGSSSSGTAGGCPASCADAGGQAVRTNPQIANVLLQQIMTLLFMPVTESSFSTPLISTCSQRRLYASKILCFLCGENIRLTQ